MTECRTRENALWVSYSSLSGVRAAEKPSGISKSYTATGGAADGTTITCAAAAAGWVGKLIRIKSASNAAAQGQDCFAVKRSTTTVTVYPPLDAQISSGDIIEIYDNPYTIIIEDGGGGAKTTITDASTGSSPMSWSTGEPVGQFAWCIHAEGSITVGECKEITAFSSTACTVESFSANVTDGDVFLVGKFVAAVNFAPNMPQTMVTRERIDGMGQSVPDLPTIRRPAPSFSLPIKSTGDGVGDGEDWATKRTGPSIDLMDAILGTLTTNAGELVTGGTSTAVEILTTTGSQFTAGNAILYNGELGVLSSITSADPDVLNLDTSAGGGPALSANPTATETVYACAMLRQATSGHYPVNFLFFEDQVMHFLMGCYGTMTWESTAGGRLMANYSYSHCQAWSSANQTCPVSIDSTHFPEDSVSDIYVQNGRVEFDGTGVEVSGVTIDWGIQLAEREDPNVLGGFRGGFVAHGEPRVTLTGFPRETKANIQYQDQGTTFQFLFQAGTEPGDVVGLTIPKLQPIDVSAAPEGGIVRETSTWKACKPASTDPLEDQIRAFYA